MKMVHVTIQTSRFEEEIDFYLKHASLKVRRDMRPVGKDLVFLGDSEASTMVEIIRNEKAEESGNAHLSVGFCPEDLDASRAELVSAGLDPTPFITPVPGVRFFYVKDPAGVNVQFIEASYL